MKVDEMKVFENERKCTNCTNWEWENVGNMYGENGVGKEKKRMRKLPDPIGCRPVCEQPEMPGIPAPKRLAEFRSAQFYSRRGRSLT